MASPVIVKPAIGVAPGPVSLTIHNAVTSVTALTAAAFGAWTGWNPVACVVGAGVTVALRAALGHFLPYDRPVERFRDVFSRDPRRHRNHHDEQIAHRQIYNVGFRYVGADGLGLPHCSCFFPTASAVSDDAKLPRFTPFNDIRYAHGFARYAQVPWVLANHQTAIRINVAVDAPAVDSVAEGLGTSRHPVIIVSHGLAGHQHMYSHFAMNLASMGAIVLCVQHTDGSGCFALAPQPGRAGDDPTHQQVAIPYQIPPPNDAKDGYPFRQEQLRTRRVPELNWVLEFASGAALRKLLGLPTSSSAAPVTLIGHSFGGTTVVSAAAAHAGSGSKLNRVVALDLWTEPLANERFNSIIQHSTSLPPLLLLDSQHWERWTENRENELRLMELWRASGASVHREHLNNTDHMTLNVLRNLINLQKARQSYCVKDRDQQHAAAWAAQAFDFACAGLEP